MKYNYLYFGQFVKDTQLKKQKQKCRLKICIFNQRTAYKLFTATQKKRYAAILALLYIQKFRRNRHYYNLKNINVA
jgi:hypothetical protein